MASYGDAHHDPDCRHARFFSQKDEVEEIKVVSGESNVVVVLLCVVKQDVEGLMVIRLRRFLERKSKQSADSRILSWRNART